MLETFYNEMGGVWEDGKESKDLHKGCPDQVGVNTDAKDTEETQRKKERTYAEDTPTGPG